MVGSTRCLPFERKPEVYILGKPAIWNRRRFQEMLDGILDSGILTNSGDLVQELESRMSGLSGGHCVAVASGTAGLELVVRALDVAGKPVLMPSFTYVATPHAAKAAGAEIAFCDVQPDTLSADLDTVGSVTPAALLVVNLFGGCGDLERYQAYADLRGIPLIFDSAHALATQYRGRPVSDYGLASVFSLHATKLIQGFEGGLVVTRSPEFAEKLRRMRNFGIGSESISPHSSVVEWGTNAKMSEVHAAMALAGFESLEDALAIHRRNFLLYRANLPEHVKLLEFPEYVESNHRFVVVTVEPAARGRLIEHLERGGCQARIYFEPPCHRLPPYAAQAQPHLPVTDEIAGRVLALPTGPEVGEEQVRAICALLAEALQAGAR